MPKRMQAFVGVGIVLGALSSSSFHSHTAEAFQSSSSLVPPCGLALARHHRNDRCWRRQSYSPGRWHISLKARLEDDGADPEEDADETTSGANRGGNRSTEREASVSVNEDEDGDDMGPEAREQKAARRGRKQKLIPSTDAAISESDVDGSGEEEKRDVSVVAGRGSEYAEEQRRRSKLRLKKMELDHEIDLLLHSPDPPFDHEAEMEKVVDKSGLKEPSVGGLHGDGDDSPDAVVERRLEELESDMYQAVEEEDFTKAAACRAQLDELHVDECSAVLQAHSNFYRAFSEKDLGAMEELWLRDSAVLCIHPSHNPISGASAVLESWKTVFDTTDATLQRNTMQPTNIRMSVRGTTAVVTCDEEVDARRLLQSRRPKVEVVNRLTATNIFRKVDGRWYMVHHHASWRASSPAARRALAAQGSEPLLPEKRPTHAFPEDDSKEELRRFVEMNLEKEAMKDAASGDGNFLSNLSPFPPAGMLGVPPSIKKQIKETRAFKRVLKGNLGGLLNSGELKGKISSSELRDIIDSAIDGSVEIDEDGGFVVENEDDEDDEVVETPKIVIRASKDLSSDTAPQSSLISEGKIVPPILAQAEMPQPASSETSKVAAQQSCIVALRSLANRGAITQKQKQILLTDMIMSSAKGESSMVEVAYGLLCGEKGGDDKVVAEDEFADQCRFFALSLPEFPQLPQPSTT